MLVPFPVREASRLIPLLVVVDSVSRPSGELHTLKNPPERGESVDQACNIQGFGLPVNRVASANQKVTNKIPSEKPEELPPCLAHKLMHNIQDREISYEP